MEKDNNDTDKKLQISDVRSLDYTDGVWDYLYNKWYKDKVYIFKSTYNDISIMNRSIDALLKRDDFIKIFKEDDKFALYWFDFLIKDF